MTEEELENRAKAIELHLTLLVHASACTLGGDCKSKHCRKMKEILMHVRLCKIQAKNGCPVRKRIHNLIPLHTSTCTRDKCLVSGCHGARGNLQNGTGEVAVAGDGGVVVGDGELLMKRARQDDEDGGGVEAGAAKNSSSS